MKTMICLILSICFLFAGCAGSPFAVSMKSPEDLKLVPDEQLCASYASFKNEKLENELKNRKLFTEKEWLAIEKQSIFVGMSKKAMLASRPNIYLTSVSNIGDYGMVEIYKEFTTTVNAYIYVQEDKVVGYQMW